jgi:hypothetical protein
VHPLYIHVKLPADGSRQYEAAAEARDYRKTQSMMADSGGVGKGEGRE